MDQTPTPGAQPTGEAPAAAPQAAAPTEATQAAPPAPPAAPTLESVTPEALRALYAKSPDLFQGLVAQTPATTAPPAAPSAAPSAADDLKLELPKDAGVDPKVIDRFKETWKSAPPETRAQAVVDFYVKMNQEAQANNAAAIAQWRKQNEETLKSDPDWKNFEEARSVAQRPLAKYASPDLLKTLDESGWSSHPELARFLHKIGKAMGEDVTRRPAPVSREIADEQAALQRRYDHPSSRGMSGLPTTSSD